MHTSASSDLVSTRPKVDATLGAGDIFDVRVFEEPELSGSYRIDSEGVIDYPMIGRLTVAGKLPGQIVALLVERLSVYVREPAVSVFVREMNSKRVTVSGQVSKPGAFQYADPMTLSQAISLAGGFSSMAARDHVLVSRFDRDKQRIIKIDFRAIAAGRSPNQFILPGDEVYVPERLF